MTFYLRVPVLDKKLTVLAGDKNHREPGLEGRMSSSLYICEVLQLSPVSNTDVLKPSVHLSLRRIPNRSFGTVESFGRPDSAEVSGEASVLFGVQKVRHFCN